MSPAPKRQTIGMTPRRGGNPMTTSLADNSKTEDWLEPPPTRGDPLFSRAELLWTAVGAVLLGAFLTLVVDDFPLRAIISVN